jgi:hypothetical protein
MVSEVHMIFLASSTLFLVQFPRLITFLDLPRSLSCFLPAISKSTIFILATRLVATKADNAISESTH